MRGALPSEASLQRRGYTGIVMIRRILPLVMMLTIALCPVALDVCQVACASVGRDPRSGPAHEHGASVTSASALHHHLAEPADAMVAHHHADHAVSAGTA